MAQKIIWDEGTAYDLFCSLRVLHDPGRYGLRPSWAAGVRSRIPVKHREILEQVHRFLFIPKQWIYGLPLQNEAKHKDGDAALWYLSLIPPHERLIHLMTSSGIPQEALNILQDVHRKKKFSSSDLENLRDAYPPDKTKPKQKVVLDVVELLSRPGESGEDYLAALKAYHRVFFAEEDKRIQPSLSKAASEAKILANRHSLDDLIESLSRGVRISIDKEIKRFIFVPSYWISPLVSFDRVDQDTAFFIFGARPANVSLIPGDVVPEGMLRSFKALGDPTRLRILKYLAQENITPAEIARRLRLRAPTVTHHLNVLRLAGLVNLTLEQGNERYYAARKGSISEMIFDLENFIEGSSEPENSN